MAEKKPTITRRTFLQTTAWASGSALILGAGCTEDENGGNPDGGDSGLGSDTYTGDETSSTIADIRFSSCSRPLEPGRERLQFPRETCFRRRSG